MAQHGGWMGKILRVNLTTGKITAEDTMKYKDFLGGAGLGYKIMWDEVPPGTKPFDPENKLIIGVGPLTGTGAVMSGRTNITSLGPVHRGLVTDGHMGGHFGSELKYAGWDSIIIEGRSPTPVWLRIENDKVTLEDARWLWGNGVYRSIAEICNIMGGEAQVAAIGQAGENMVPMSTIITSYSHSAGGHGGVMGSKNLKAIGVRGTLPIRIAGTKEQWRALDEYALSLVGSNNQAVIPRFPQPWAEYHSPESRWYATKGLYWGAADPPIDTGTCHPDDKQSIGYRCHKGFGDHGEDGEKYTVRMGGCHSCPVRCDGHLKVPQVEQYGYSMYVANTCNAWQGNAHMLKGMSQPTIVYKALGKHLNDDYGLWNNYSQLARDFAYAYNSGILKKVIPEDEWNSIRFDLMEAKDPAFLLDFFRRIAFKEGELSRLGDGAYEVAKAWGFGYDYYHGYASNIWNPELGYPKHHSNEIGAQVGALINCMFNRDACSHTHSNLMRGGLPIHIQKAVVEKIVGSPDAADDANNYTPMNIYKAKFAKWCLIRNHLHNSLTLCNWMWPLMTSPHKRRNYMGDTSLEAQYYSLATGDKKSEKELDLVGERILTLLRALTVRSMGTVDMRNKHDVMADWIFDYPKDAKPFTPGSIKMDREDMQKALTMFYQECGWDEKTGAPTKATLLRLGLDEVAAELESKGLLPS